MIAGKRRLTCVALPGKWRMQVFPPAVGVAAQVVQLIGGDAEKLARDAYSGYGGRPSPTCAARTSSPAAPAPMALHRRSVSFKDEASEDVLEVDTKVAAAGSSESWWPGAASAMNPEVIGCAMQVLVAVLHIGRHAAKKSQWGSGKVGADASCRAKRVVR